jgi:hypothetical protein
MGCDRRTIARFRRPGSAGAAVLLLLSTTTELVIVTLVPQHDRQPNPELASHSHSLFPQTFLNQTAVVETL